MSRRPSYVDRYDQYEEDFRPSRSRYESTYNSYQSPTTAYGERSGYRGSSRQVYTPAAYGDLDPNRDLYQSPPPPRNSSIRDRDYRSSRTRERSPPPGAYDNRPLTSQYRSRSLTRDRTAMSVTDDHYLGSSRDPYRETGRTRSGSLTVDSRLSAIPGRSYESPLIYEREPNRRDSTGTYRTSSISSNRYEDLVYPGESHNSPGYERVRVIRRSEYYPPSSSSSYYPGSSRDYDSDRVYNPDGSSRRFGSRFR